VQTEKADISSNFKTRCSHESNRLPLNLRSEGIGMELVGWTQVVVGAVAIGVSVVLFRRQQQNKSLGFLG
jgi:hypothetical protein